MRSNVSTDFRDHCATVHHPPIKLSPRYAVRAPRAGWVGITRYAETMVSNSLANRFRATCSRRLIVPTGESNASLISISD